MCVLNIFKVIKLYRLKSTEMHPVSMIHPLLVSHVYIAIWIYPPTHTYTHSQVSASKRAIGWLLPSLFSGKSPRPAPKAGKRLKMMSSLICISDITTQHSVVFNALPSCLRMFLFLVMSFLIFSISQMCFWENFWN